MKRLPFGLTPTKFTIFLSVVIILVVTYLLGSLYFSAQTSATRTARLYRLITTPDVKEEPLAATESQGKATIYYKDSIPTIVVVVSDLAPLESDQQYIAWFQSGDENLSRQRVRFDSDGIGRISQEGYDPAVLDRVIIARERANTIRQDGPVVLRWERR